MYSHLQSTISKLQPLQRKAPSLEVFFLSENYYFKSILILIVFKGKNIKH